MEANHATARHAVHLCEQLLKLVILPTDQVWYVCHDVPLVLNMLRQTFVLSAFKLKERRALLAVVLFVGPKTVFESLGIFPLHSYFNASLFKSLADR